MPAVRAVLRVAALIPPVVKNGERPLCKDY